MFDIQAYLPIIMIVFSVLGLVILIALLARNYYKIPPNKVAVFYGKKNGDKGYKVITGGSKFKIPIIEDVEFMDMAAFLLGLKLVGIPNKDGVLVNIDAVATCKISSDGTLLMAAVERFLGKPVSEVNRMVQENLEGQLRSVVGTMTIEQLIQDRETLNNKVKQEAAGDLEKLGVIIDVLNIQSITDDSGYIHALGQKRTAEVMKDAQVGKAEAEREAKQLSTTAEKEGNVAAAQNDAMTAEAEKDRDVKKADYTAAISKQQAIAAQAGPLASAEAQKAVVIAQQQVAEAKARAEAGVKEQQAIVAEKQQYIDQVIPAAKAADATIKTAEGQKRSLILESEGSREAAINNAEAVQATMTKEGEGEAAKIRAIGLAKGAAIQAELEGEAAGLLKKAEAYKAMDQGAQLQLILEKFPSILEKIPAIMSAIATPLSAIDKVVVIENGSGGASGQTGVQKFVGNVPGVLMSLFNIMRESGFDPSRLFEKAGITGTGMFDDVKSQTPPKDLVTASQETAVVHKPIE